MRALVWFRSDLRVNDNPALSSACKAADRGVAGLFIVTPEQWRAHDWGAPKAGFVLRGVGALSKSLERLNVGLRVEVVARFEGVARVVARVCRELECDAVYWNREYEVNESRRDEDVEEALGQMGVRVVEFEDQVLLKPGTVRTGEGRFYTVFTPFRKAAVAALAERGVELASKARKQAAMVCAGDEIPGLEDVGYSGTSTHASLWTASESEAARRLERFTQEKIEAYAVERDLPGVDGTSTLSPYLSAGMVSVRQCLAGAMNANRGKLEGGKKGPATWVNELLWREFYRHLLVGFPRLSMGRAFRPATELLRWSEDEEHLGAWREGRTGVPLVDAGMRQLKETGWMHNRVRMVTAMYLTKTLFISWREGERHFMQRLVDADLANNNGGWQWAASTGTDAAPYFRIFNPESQAKRFDPECEYIYRWVPELRRFPVAQVHGMSRVSGAALREVGYPGALVDYRSAKQRVIGAFAGLRG